MHELPVSSLNEREAPMNSKDKKKEILEAWRNFVVKLSDL
jgi:hypothetical protein